MHRVVAIEKTSYDALDFKSLYFKDEKCAKAIPGQFIMVWVPGVDEIPMSISRICVDGYSSITVLKVGEATEWLHRMKVGDKIGIRGPFGNGFSMEGYNNIALIGGGSGSAVILATVYYAMSLGKKFDVFLGARTKDMVPFIKELKDLGIAPYVSTDDGTLGYKGTVVDLFIEKVKIKDYDLIISCGPEKMLYKIALLSEELGIEAQISVERYMKCGLGVCGTCAMDGYLVCKDGPVFDARTLLRTKEFGKIRREGSGRLVAIR